MKSMNRREFLKSSVGAAAAFAALPKRKSYAANKKIIIGMMGLGGRGVYLAEQLLERSDVEIAYLCDVDSRRFARAREAVEELQNRRPKIVKDFRKMLDDPNVDAIVNATPDHWHCLGTIMACQTGKDVYVEKPLSQSIWEGRKTVEAARKYNRIVQVGTQCRSSKELKSAAEYIRSGKLGKVSIVRVYHMLNIPGPASKPKPEPVPEGFDYDMWCGPAPKLPYRKGRWWPNFWDFGCGNICEDAVHQLDLARALIGKAYPDTVYCVGAINVAKDGREAPDTQTMTYEYGKMTLAFQGALWTPYMKKTSWGIRDSNRFPDWQFNSTKIEILGSEGFMYYGRHGGGWQAYDLTGKLVHSEYGRHPINEHLDNFIDCIRTRNKPNGDVEEAHLSALMCHAANISFRIGNQKLKIDPKTESFDDSKEANQYLRRKDRNPWVIPEKI